MADEFEERIEPMVEVEDLCKSYGSLRAVDGVSFSIKPGEVFGILGPNGAGKTTTLEILEGMRAPDSGFARISGIDVRDNPRTVKSMIGIQLQSAAFFDRLNLSEILEVFGSLYHRKVNAMALLGQVELEDRAKAMYKELSGGQKQRFSMATTLVNDPLVLFLDEPTTGLDPQARRHMWDLVKGFKSQGRTVLLSTHYMEEAEELCDRRTPSRAPAPRQRFGTTTRRAVHRRSSGGRRCEGTGSRSQGVGRGSASRSVRECLLALRIQDLRSLQTFSKPLFVAATNLLRIHSKLAPAVAVATTANGLSSRPACTPENRSSGIAKSISHPVPLVTGSREGNKPSGLKSAAAIAPIPNRQTSD